MLNIALSSLQSILQQHCDRHWTYTTRNRSNPTCSFRCFLKIYISNKPVTRLPRWVINSICANIYDCRSRFDPTSFDLITLANFPLGRRLVTTTNTWDFKKKNQKIGSNNLKKHKINKSFCGTFDANIVYTNDTMS